ncbi:PLP-dependent aminotransferase family protein [Halovenus rubra]|uniref:PLP-dependent aminotransferase family protein n=2 Tax=Halovenus rubra TaxID=869890 RepID=A0ACC7E0M4_9EURY|nr:PLP-dependent aminotransferase family protein [Halovenus rubra]
MDHSAYGSWRNIATDDAVSLSFGFPDPDLFPEDKLHTSLKTVLADEGDDALQYGGGDYQESLTSFLKEQERERGIDFETHELLVTNGATDAIDTVCRAFLEPGDTLIVEKPTFMGVLGVFRNFGVNIVGVPVDDDGMDVEALADLLETRQTAGQESPKLLYTIPDFHNPTGTTLSRERRERLLELATEYEFGILEDGAYSDLWLDEQAPPPIATLDTSERVIRVGSFAKTVAPGIRMGWLTAPSKIRTAARSVASGGTNTLIEGVLGKYCEAGYFDDLLPEIRETYRAKRDHMLAELDRQMPADVTWTDPTGGFFIWVELPEGIDSQSMLEPAAETGVTYLPGPLFYPDDGGSNSLRLSFTYVKQDEITAGIKALAESIETAR